MPLKPETRNPKPKRIASINSPDDPLLQDLRRELAERSTALEQPGGWPAEQLALCGQRGVYEWFLPRDCGGRQWSDADITRGYLVLGEACLTTTFVITQYMGACQRLASSDQSDLKLRWLPDLLAGKRFATVGISHLTTSRRHLQKPVLSAEPVAGGYLLDGYSPWATGAPQADAIAIGAGLEDGKQLLAWLPTDREGVSRDAPAELTGLTASQTGAVRCRRVFIGEEEVLAGPAENVMKRGAASTGGLQTSTLAVGLAGAALHYLQTESQKRDNLLPPYRTLRQQQQDLQRDLLAAAEGDSSIDPLEIRRRANSLALRCSQAALAAAKGAGYLSAHNAGRWCREAMFFLVWSCPAPVLEANLCELASEAVA